VTTHDTRRPRSYRKRAERMGKCCEIARVDIWMDGAALFLGISGSLAGRAGPGGPAGSNGDPGFLRFIHPS